MVRLQVRVRVRLQVRVIVRLQIRVMVRLQVRVRRERFTSSKSWQKSFQMYYFAVLYRHHASIY